MRLLVVKKVKAPRSHHKFCKKGDPPTSGETVSLADIEWQPEKIELETITIVTRAANGKQTDPDSELLKSLANEAAALKGKQAHLNQQQENNAQGLQRVLEATASLKEAPSELVKKDESIIWQLVETVKGLSANKILVCLRGGAQIEQDLQ